MLRVRLDGDDVVSCQPVDRLPPVQLGMVFHVVEAADRDQVIRIRSPERLARRGVEVQQRRQLAGGAGVWGSPLSNTGRLPGCPVTSRDLIYEGRPKVGPRRVGALAHQQPAECRKIDYDDMPSCGRRPQVVHVRPDDGSSARWPGVFLSHWSVARSGSDRSRAHLEDVVDVGGKVGSCQAFAPPRRAG